MYNSSAYSFLPSFGLRRDYVMNVACQIMNAFAPHFQLNKIILEWFSCFECTMTIVHAHTSTNDDANHVVSWFLMPWNWGMELLAVASVVGFLLAANGMRLCFLLKQVIHG